MGPGPFAGDTFRAVPLVPCRFAFLAAFACCLPALAQQPDTLGRPPHDPQKALRRALVVPGGGQFYNHQPVKAGIFYAGVAGIAALYLHNNRQYHLYQHVFRYAERPERYPQYADEAAPFQTLIGNGGKGRIREARDKARRNRDLSAIGGGVWYALSVLDAYVGAHLIDFDTGDALSLRVAPAPGGFAFGATLALP